MSFFIHSSEDERNFAFVNNNLIDMGTEPCIICDTQIPNMVIIGNSAYPVCPGACERRLVDILTYRIIFHDAKVKGDWCPTWDYSHSIVVMNHINSLGFYISLFQEGDKKWRCMASSSLWKKDAPYHTVLDNDPFLALCKMLVYLFETHSVD
jgi:hypothetical protein